MPITSKIIAIFVPMSTNEVISKENKISFDQSKTGFYTVLKKRVNEYFESNHISDKWNGEMVTKTIVLISSAIACYYAILFVPAPLWVGALLCAIMGFIMAGIGFSIQHDANHEGYSDNPQVNYWLGLTLNIMGGNADIWRVKHNINHHTYTNIDGYDDDIAKHPVFRFSPQQKRKWFHRFQSLYWIPMYSVSSILWVFFNDYHKLIAKKIVKTKMRPLDAKEKFVFWTFKLISLFLSLILPGLIVGWGHAFAGFFICHITLGYTLSLIFQLAHTVEDTEFPVPNDLNKVEEEWAVHQVRTTANFATDNRILNWYVGGLNFQIEHHLFPRICHVHYPKIAKIVEATCKEFNIPYTNHSTFIGSFASHVKHLHRLGIED